MSIFCKVKNERKQRRVCTPLEQTPIQFPGLITDDLQPPAPSAPEDPTSWPLLMSTMPQTSNANKNKNKNKILKHIDKKMLK